MIFTMILAIENESDQDFMLDIYQRYNKLIRKTIYKTVNNLYDIEDLTNDTFIKLIMNISTIRNLSCHKMTAYIVYTSKNVAIDYIKHRDVLNRHIYFGVENDLSDELTDILGEFEEKLIHQLDIELLCKAIQKLPEAKKNILYFKYILDMKDVDIAKSLGISPNSVPQLIKRARNAAKHLIGKEADTYAI